MSALELGKLISTQVAPRLVDTVKDYGKEGPGYDKGVYIYHNYDMLFPNVYLTYLDSRGELPSMEFMVSIKNTVEDVLCDVLDDKFPYSISSAITDWEWGDSDMITKCGSLYPDGVLIWNDFSNGICNIVNGSGTNL